jgi:hypothetical protein
MCFFDKISQYIIKNCIVRSVGLLLPVAKWNCSWGMGTGLWKREWGKAPSFVLYGCHLWTLPHWGKKKKLFNLKRKKKGGDYHSTIQEQFWHKLKLFFIFSEFLKFYFVTFIPKKIIIIIELRVCKFSTVGFESNLVLDTLNCPINLTIVCSLFYFILNYYLLKISELKTQLPKLSFNFFN